MDLYSIMRLNFGRDHAVIAAISNQISDKPMLEYPGQSLLFYVLFFIPRKWFPIKPWPYSNILRR